MTKSGSGWESWQKDPSTDRSFKTSKDGTEILYGENANASNRNSDKNHMHFYQDGSYSQKRDGDNIGGIKEDINTAVTGFLGSNNSSSSSDSSSSSSSSSADADAGSFNLFDPSTW